MTERYFEAWVGNRMKKFTIAKDAMEYCKHYLYTSELPVKPPYGYYRVVMVEVKRTDFIKW